VLPGLDERLDPATYVLSPGDRVALSIWGSVDLTVDLIVTADGALLVPSVGRLEVAGIPLAEAAERLRKEASRAYPRSEITLSLVRPGLLRIPITGQVVDPGSYELLSSSRLADLVTLAGGLREGADGRAVIITNGEAQQTYDFLAWQIDGRAAGNPRLLSGNRVHIAPMTESVRVRGILPREVENQRSSLLDRPFESESVRVPYHADDRVDFVLRAAGWPGKDFCAEGVWAISPQGERSWVPLERAAATPLEPGMVIEVPFCREWVAVTGAVQRPGYYPFLPGQTAADYVGLAGGPSSIGRDQGWKAIDDAGEAFAIARADTIAAGARLWVPERRMHKFSTLLGPVGTAVALIVSLVAISSGN
jgi:polysaccharide export outer membrane protein